MNSDQENALVELARQLEAVWDDLDIGIVTSWETFENCTPDGPFRDRLRADS